MSHNNKGLDTHEKRPSSMTAFRTPGFYAAAFLVLIVYVITPASWAAILANYSLTGAILTLPTDGIVLHVCYIYALLEVPFSVYLQYLIWKGSSRLPPPELDRDSLRKLLTQCLTVGLSAKTFKRARKHKLYSTSKLMQSPVDAENAAILRDRFRVWFHHASIRDIYADNIREWLSWAFASRPLNEVQADAEMRELIDEGLDMIVWRLQIPDLTPGYNPKVKTVRLTLDPMRVLSRPLGYYIACNGINHGTIAWLRICHGFRYESSGQCSFLVKPPTSQPTPATPDRPSTLPILFLHGLGIGIGQYMAFLRHLALHTHGVVILVQPHISADISHPQFLHPPSKDEQAQATAALLERFHLRRVTTVSHSNGTMVLGWLLRHRPDLCARNVLVDPVSFRLWEGHVCYAFVYRRWTTAMHVLLGYFVARELGTARTIGRLFQWNDMCLWMDEFVSIQEDDLHIVFGGADALVDVPSCVEYVEECGVPEACISVMAGYPHGKALMFNSKGMQVVLQHARIGQ